jgi:hypothetical protein
LGASAESLDNFLEPRRHIRDRTVALEKRPPPSIAFLLTSERASDNPAGSASGIGVPRRRNVSPLIAEASLLIPMYHGRPGASYASFEDLARKGPGADRTATKGRCEKT